MAIFQAYYDHSYTGDGATRAVTLACLIASKQSWLRFSADWNAALKQGGAEGKLVHMRELVHGRGNWVGWEDPEKQNALFDRLVPVLSDHLSWGFCVSYPLSFWDGVTATGSSAKKSLTPLALTLNGILAHVAARAPLTAADPLHSYMEEDSLVEAEMTNTFYSLSAVYGWRDIFPLIRPLSKGPPPLQAADMVAYEGSRNFSEQVLGGAPARYLYVKLWNCRPKLSFEDITRKDFHQWVSGAEKIRERLKASPDLSAKIDKVIASAEKRTQRERSAIGIERKKHRRLTLPTEPSESEDE